MGFISLAIDQWIFNITMNVVVGTYIELNLMLSYSKYVCESNKNA